MSVQSNFNQWMQMLGQLTIGKKILGEAKETRKTIKEVAGPTGPVGPTGPTYDEQGNIKMPSGQEGGPVDPHFASSGPVGPMGAMAGPDGSPVSPRPRKPTAAETVTQEAQRRRDIDNWRDIAIQKMRDVGYSNKAIKKFAYKTKGGDE